MAVDNLDKITFLNELEQELNSIPSTERDNVMYEYEQYFFDQEREGKNEYQIIGALDSPKKIGKEIKAKNAIVSAEYRPNVKSIIRAIMASLGMGILSLIIILIPMIFIGSFMFILLLVAFFLAISPILLIIHGSLYNMFSLAISNYLFAFSFTGLGIVLFVIIAKLAQFVYRLILKYLRWNIKTIKGSANE
ncbi:HAAS signaling domain-containing protein [Staphylococcus shinii]|uniref:HAAS signaling domain-containing protein n=1 Tax=Staphylococcus shinii TaxID=2912228 RepID=UPI003F82F628